MPIEVDLSDCLPADAKFRKLAADAVVRRTLLLRLRAVRPFFVLGQLTPQRLKLIHRD